jgi:transposase
MPTTRRYTKDEKDQAVRLVFELRKELGATQGTVVQVADQLAYGTESVRQRVADAEIEAGDAPGVSAAERAKMKKLEQENSELRRANEILKRASAFYFGGARPPPEIMVKFIDENREDFGSSPSVMTLQVAHQRTTTTRNGSHRPVRSGMG